VVARGWRAPWSASRPIHRALFFSLLDGLAAYASIGVVERFAIPYAIKLGFSNQQIGLFAGIPYVMASLSNLISPGIVARTGRRKSLCLAAVFSQVFWLVCLLSVSQLHSGARFYAALLVFTMYATFGQIQMGAWGSWMADLLPDSSRSRYFGWRDQITGFFAMPFAYLCAVLLDASPAGKFAGFAIVFGMAAVFRAFSGLAVWAQYEPPMTDEPSSEQVSFLGFLSGAGNHDALTASMYFAAIIFATRLCGPFFQVYMLRDLELSYKSFTVLTLVASLTHLVFIHFWGRLGDRFGNAKLLRVVWPGIVAIPALWTISGNFYYLVGLQIIAGFCWSAFFLASWNYILDATSRETRGRYISYSLVLRGVAGAISPFIGGLILSYLPPLGGYQIRTLFALSAGLRLMAGFLTLGRLREVKPVGRLGANQLIYALPGIRPLTGMYRAFARRFSQDNDTTT